jgi:hypothetical protein
MDTITALTTLDFTSIFISVFVILVGLKAIVSIFDWIVGKLGLETKWGRKRREERELLNNTSKDISKLKKEFADTKNEIDNRRIHDREQSFSVQKELTEAIKSLGTKVESLIEQNKKYELSDTRDRLLQAHRYYFNKHINPTLKWTEMEAHAFWEQFETYESLGGDGYMHSVVEPDMRSLIEVPMVDVNEISKLFESRYKEEK